MAGTREIAQRNGKLGGRPKDALRAELRQAAKKFTPDALKTLGDIMLHGKQEAARIMAARELLDRAHGKPAQAVTDADGNNLPIPAAIAFIINKAPNSDARE